MVDVQYGMYACCPKSLMGFSGEPTFSSFLLSSYEKAMRNRPSPFLWWEGNVRMHARLYPTSEYFSFEKYPSFIQLAEHVEQKGIDVEVERL